METLEYVRIIPKDKPAGSKFGLWAAFPLDFWIETTGEGKPLIKTVSRIGEPKREFEIAESIGPGGNECYEFSTHQTKFIVVVVKKPGEIFTHKRAASSFKNFTNPTSNATLRSLLVLRQMLRYTHAMNMATDLYRRLAITKYKRKKRKLRQNSFVTKPLHP